MVLRVLSVLQGFEPTGVAARNVAECLRLQLVDRGRFDPAMEALLANLDLLARHDMTALRKACAVDEEDLKEDADKDDQAVDAIEVQDARKVLAEELRTQADEVTGVADEYQEAVDNVGDGKLNSEEWSEKADALISAADSMTSAADEIEDDEESTLEELLEKAQNAVDEVTNV
jgi:DNA-directed RNA polymerase specialized sigma54-like protein